MGERRLSTQEQFASRFWSKVKQGQSCWLWRGGLSRDGYGRIGWNGREWGAHRAAWFLTENVVPKVCVLHRCDVRACVRPSHLFLGTQKDNNHDMAAKGRARGPRGWRNGQTKLSDVDVRAIQQEYVRGVSVRGIARRFGVHHGTIQYRLGFLYRQRPGVT